jgi:hypothetical protein
MKANTVKLCAVLLLTASTLALAQKTEVRVQRGKIIAETGSASVAVDAGRKAVMTPDQGVSVAVDDPMVDDLIRILRWIEEERQAQRERIDSSAIQIVKIDSESRFTLAYLREAPNTEPTSSHTCRISDASVLDDPEFYDLQGNRLSFDMDKLDARRADYFVRFPAPVEPGKEFRFICVSKLNGFMWKEGPLWHLQVGWCVPRCLNYFRLILPPSAIFVDSNRPVTVIDSVGGNVAVTVRNYTGDMADGVSHIAFLWPEKDGTGLADLPPQYRGLRDAQEQDMVRVGQFQLARILAGETYNDQSNPLAAVATLCSAVIQKDKELLLSLMASPFLRALAESQYEEFIRDAGGQLVEAFDFLSTPTWPDAPQNGYEHPVYLSRKGSLLHDATMTMVYRDGKWYSGGLTMNVSDGAATQTPADSTADAVKISQDRVDLSVATYAGLEPGRFLRKWLFLGPINIPWHGEGYFPDAQAQKEFFDADPLPPAQFEPEVKIGDKNYRWAVLDAEYGLIDLSVAFKDWFQVGYAWAQIDMPEGKQGVLGIGSDDSIKVWLNGELVHTHWETTGRGVMADNDRVPVTFRKGRNQLVLKIQNGGGPWGFACRLLEP